MQTDFAHFDFIRKIYNIYFASYIARNIIESRALSCQFCTIDNFKNAVNRFRIEETRVIKCEFEYLSSRMKSGAHELSPVTRVRSQRCAGSDQLQVAPVIRNGNVDCTIPHGNGGKMASPIPCVAGKHFLSRIFTCIFTYVARECRSFVERTIVRSNSLLEDARIHSQPLLHDSSG